MTSKYYTLNRIQNIKDLDKKTPEIYIIMGNKAAGKTTAVSKYLLDNFFTNNQKFGLIYRFNYELDDIADKFFKDIHGLFFKNYIMKSERKAGGIYAELFIAKDEEKPIWQSCGYGVTLNSSEQLKKYSHLFSDIGVLFFDEFQSETNHYCGKEVHKFQLLHSTIARGQGKQSRYVPVYMCSNAVSIVNPYFLALGISNRLQKNTKILRGHGFVLEITQNKSAEKAMEESSFVKAFGSSEFNEYAIKSVYLNDSEAFIEKPTGESHYILTIKNNGKLFGIYEYETGVVYVSNKADPTFRYKLSVGINDHDKNFLLLRTYDPVIDAYKKLFEIGQMRFKNQECKDAFLQLIKYRDNIN